MRRVASVAAAIALLAGLPPMAAAEARACTMAKSDAAWLRDSIAAWRYTARTHLHLADHGMPPTVVFDKACVFRVDAKANPIRWTAAAHTGQVKLPDVTEIPAGVVSFARPSAQGTYFVMSLPSVWREKVKSSLGLERLMTAVLLHETSHTAQARVLAPRLDALPDDMSDDALQAHFKGNAAYVADFTRERDLFLSAAIATSPAETKRLAREGLAAWRARRAKWFTGDDAKWAEIDDLFVAMEGLGQWTAYAWLADPKGANVPRDMALTEMRRGGKWWTQDEGLAMFLAIDRLVPRWQQRLFEARPPSLESILETAAR